MKKLVKNLIDFLKFKVNNDPYKIITLKTGVICEHYKNGEVKIKTI